MQVVITPKALKQYNHLPTQDQLKIKRKLIILEQSPLEGKKLTGSLTGVRSLKAWPYRILYYIDEKSKKVFIVTTAHRQGVYN